jgi:hypothetical protein
LKRSLSSIALLFMAMIVSVSAFAKGKSADVQIYQPSQIAGATLQPGSYKMTLNFTGSTANVVFSQNGKQVATVTGQVVQLAKRADNTAITLDNSSGSSVISQIDVEGSQSAVSFAQNAASASTGE